ncbi:MAG TPA: hypothetical protein VN894_03070 [Polyangiaceae bacterium]|nr:hypothetical protein [Polyangiaceae bacterium]
MFACVVACSPSREKAPPDLGNCIPPPDAACAILAGGGGSASGTAESGAAVEDGATAGACGGAESLVMNNNMYCEPCIVSSCCMAAMRCDATCEAVVQCTQPCAQGDLSCVGGCEGNPTWQAGITAYLDFANCVSGACPSCPTLQHQ